MAPSSFALASAPGSGDLEGLAGIINDDGAGVCYVVSSTYQAADEDEDHDEDRGDGTWTLRVGEDGKSARWWLGSWTGDALRKTTMGKSKGTDKTWAAFVQRIHAAWERGELSLRVSQRHQNTMEEIKLVLDHTGPSAVMVLRQLSKEDALLQSTALAARLAAAVQGSIRSRLSAPASASATASPSTTPVTVSAKASGSESDEAKALREEKAKLQAQLASERTKYRELLGTNKRKAAPRGVSLSTPGRIKRRMADDDEFEGD